jgi:hypothetical protein
VNHRQANAILDVLAARKGEGASEHCLRREQIGIIQIDATTGLPFDRLGIDILQSISAMELDEMAWLSRCEGGNENVETEMLAAQGAIGQNRSQNLLPALLGSCRSRFRRMSHRTAPRRFENTSIKKDFRRGGSCPPPEVRHGLRSRLTHE